MKSVLFHMPGEGALLTTCSQLASPLATWRGRAERVDLPPQGPAEPLSHPAAAVAPRRSCGVREGPRLAGFPSQQPPAALLLLLSAQGRTAVGDFDTPAEPFSDFSSGLRFELSLGVYGCTVYVQVAKQL